MKPCAICGISFKPSSKINKYCSTWCAYEAMKNNYINNKSNAFKSRKRKQKVLDREYEVVEYQCPVCKKWFNSYYNGYNQGGVRLHISKVGKSEAVAKALGEIKTKPHFDFWKKYTKPTVYLYNPREWKI